MTEYFCVSVSVLPAMIIFTATVIFCSQGPWLHRENGASGSGWWGTGRALLGREEPVLMPCRPHNAKVQGRCPKTVLSLPKLVSLHPPFSPGTKYAPVVKVPDSQFLCGPKYSEAK